MYRITYKYYNILKFPLTESSVISHGQKYNNLFSTAVFKFCPKEKCYYVQNILECLLCGGKKPFFFPCGVVKHENSNIWWSIPQQQSSQNSHWVISRH